MRPLNDEKSDTANMAQLFAHSVKSQSFMSERLCRVERDMFRSYCTGIKHLCMFL